MLLNFYPCQRYTKHTQLLIHNYGIGSINFPATHFIMRIYWILSTTTVLRGDKKFSDAVVDVRYRSGALFPYLESQFCYQTCFMTFSNPFFWAQHPDLPSSTSSSSSHNVTRWRWSYALLRKFAVGIFFCLPSLINLMCNEMNNNKRFSMCTRGRKLFYLFRSDVNNKKKCIGDVWDEMRGVTLLWIIDDFFLLNW